jgi:hypothetical protein
MNGKTARILVIASAFMWLITQVTVHAAQDPVEFSADLVITEPDSTINAKLYVSGSNIHRIELSKKSGGMIYLRPPEARGKIWMLDPAKKQYKILSWPQTHMDPLEAWTDIQYDMGGGPVGEETINGQACKVFHFKYKGEDKVSLKMWLAEDLKYTIKREADARILVVMGAEPKTVKGTFEILNIKTEKLDSALFEVPLDFVEVQ